MEMALRNAMGGSARDNEAKRRKKNDATQRHALEDVYERTRQHHVANTKK